MSTTASRVLIYSTEHSTSSSLEDMSTSIISTSITPYNVDRQLRKKERKRHGETGLFNNHVVSFYAPTAPGRTGSWECAISDSHSDDVSLAPGDFSDIGFTYHTESSAFDDSWSKLHALIEKFKCPNNDLHIVCIKSGLKNVITFYMEQLGITDEIIDFYVQSLPCSRKKLIHNKEGYDTIGLRHVTSKPGRWYVRDAFKPDILEELEKSDDNKLNDPRIQNFINFEIMVRQAIQLMFARHGYSINLEQILPDPSTPRCELMTRYSLDMLWSQPGLARQGKHCYALIYPYGRT